MYIKNIQEFNTEKALQAIKNNEKIIFENPTIILASKSISRKRIMEQAGISFVVLPSIVDEEKIADLEKTPQGAYNIRKNGQADGRSSTANILIESKTDISRKMSINQLKY